jgi:hypothetical protein
MNGRAGACVVLAASCAVHGACAPARGPTGADGAGARHRPPTPSEWDAARRALAVLRSTAPQRPYSANVRVALHEPRTARDYDARGGLAVAPGRAMRLVLVGPAGATALDAWVTPDHWRIAVPPLDRVQRGGRESGAARAMPVGFFRWWFLAPLTGDLVAGAPDARWFLLRDDGAFVELYEDPVEGLEHLVATRREAPATERVDWVGRSLAPSAGDRATYVQAQSGLRVEVVVESVADSAPPEQAFDDPDAARTSE